jgi:hypothetical protein
VPIFSAKVVEFDGWDCVVRRLIDGNKKCKYDIFIEHDVVEGDGGIVLSCDSTLVRHVVEG